MARKTASAEVVSPDQAAALEAMLTTGLGKTRYRPGPPCSVGKVLHALPAATAAKVLAEIDDDANSSAALADMLIAAGFDVSAYTVSRHRRRGAANGCRCPR